MTFFHAYFVPITVPFFTFFISECACALFLEVYSVTIRTGLSSAPRPRFYVCIFIKIIFFERKYSSCTAVEVTIVGKHSAKGLICIKRLRPYRDVTKCRILRHCNKQLEHEVLNCDPLELVKASLLSAQTALCAIKYISIEGK